MITNKNIKTKLVNFSGLNAIYTQVLDFPIGVDYSFRKMEINLPKSSKRKFFGAISHKGNEVIYQACASLLKENEELNSGYEKVFIPGGKYVLYTLENWSKNTHLVKEIFEELQHKYLIDPNRPQLEHYRNKKELEIMLPIKNREEQLSFLFDV